jgi:hypothetical protein
MAQITLNSTGVASNGTLALQTNGTTPALTIDASQNVGIGTGTPSSLLTVNGESNISNVVFKQNVSAYTTGLNSPVIARASGFTGVYASGSLLLQSRSDAAADIAFITGTTPAESMRITSAGDVGIGTISPFAKLSAEQAGGNLITARYNSSNPPTGVFIGGSSGAGFFGSNLNWSSGNTFNYAASSFPTYWIGNPAGQAALSFGYGSGTAGTDALTSTERMRIDSSGNLQVQTGAVMPYAPAPASISTTATLTNANIRAQIINTTGTTYTVTMPLGTTLETLASWATTGIGYDFFVINTASGTVTMAVNTGVTSLGTLTIATGVSAQFRIRRTGANTFVLYRLG